MRALRICLTLIVLAVAAAVGFSIVRDHVVLEPGVRVTVETQSVTNAVCHISWATSEDRAFAAARSLDVSVSAGKGDICIDLPVRSRLTGLRVTAPGIVLGRVTVLGNRRLMRCDTVVDIPEKLDIPAMRLPHWKSGGE